MNIAQHSQRRHTTKAFDASRTIPEASVELLCTLLRLSPSSVNSQPWHFILARSEEGKARIAKATQAGFSYNEAKVRNASHIVVLCARTDMDPPHLHALLEQEQADGRFSTPQAREGQSNSRNHYVNLHRYDQKDLQHWMEKQVYLALGSLLLGAETLGINACPMEGFDARILDAELGLHAQCLTSVVMVALGYSSSEDFNAKLPKSRLPSSSVFTNI
jgi:nitroreductase/dihydropteridine reductase